MNLDKHELKLLAAALAVVPAGEPLRVSLLAGVFDRPGTLSATVDKLRIGGMVTLDPFQGVLRVLPDKVWRALNQYGITPELFTQERPMDAMLAEVSRATLRNDTGLRDFAPVPPKPPDPPPAPKPPVHDRSVSCANHANHAPHAMPEIMPEHAPKPAKPARNAHVHGSCNSAGIQKLHGHGGGNLPGGINKGTKGHEVGELGRRSTEEMLADILKLAPGMTAENLEHWQSRIEREDAALVNGIIRQGFLQRRMIRNIGGWMNACYLKGIGKKTVTP